MVSAALDGPGLRLTAAELLSLRDEADRFGRRRPATRRPGMVPARPAGSGMDLREIRAFSHGDDARRIDPATTARTGVPHVRSFHEDRDDTVVLIADFRGPMLWGTGSSLRSVRAARALARRGWEAVGRSASIAAIAVSGQGTAVLQPGQGARQMAAVADLLATCHDRALEAGGAGPPLSEALVRALRLAATGADVLIATGPDGIAGADEDALGRLARRRRVTVLLPLDPLEVTPPAAALPIRWNGATRTARLEPLGTADLARRLDALAVTLETIANDAG